MFAASLKNRSTLFLSSIPKSESIYPMDLSLVIGELRAELESIDEAIASLEKLNEVRKRRTSSEAQAGIALNAQPRPRSRRANSGESHEKED